MGIYGYGVCLIFAGAEKNLLSCCVRSVETEMLHESAEVMGECCAKLPVI
jgi:hypothetical protein